MKTKTKIIYICDYCKKEHLNYSDAAECEAKCLGLTVEEYFKYLDLLKEEKEAYEATSCRNNDRIRQRCDDATNAVIEFQKQHNIKSI